MVFSPTILFTIMQVQLAAKTPLESVKENIVTSEYPPSNDSQKLLYFKHKSGFDKIKHNHKILMAIVKPMTQPKKNKKNQPTPR